jgi:parvulin-like peptidyl-prolyl isomerase
MDVEFDSAEQVKDRTKWIWVGVGILLCLMVAALYRWNHMNPRQSFVQLKHILIRYDQSDPAAEARALKLITEIRQRIVDGESFSRLAEEYSNDPGSAPKGGNLGTCEKGDLVEPVEEYAWTAPIGQLSDVIKTRFGFHLVIVDYRKISEADKAYEADQERLREELERRKKEREQDQ